MTVLDKIGSKAHIRIGWLKLFLILLGAGASLYYWGKVWTNVKEYTINKIINDHEKEMKQDTLIKEVKELKYFIVNFDKKYEENENKQSKFLIHYFDSTIESVRGRDIKIITHKIDSIKLERMDLKIYLKELLKGISMEKNLKNLKNSNYTVL